MEIEADTAQTEMLMEIAHLDENVQDQKTEELEKSYEDLGKKILDAYRKGQKYKDNYEDTASDPSSLSTQTPAPARSFSKSSTLERLPLPVFKGTKMEYLRFKEEFKKQVSYDQEGDKVIALKQKCLSKEKDKRRVANELTLQGCWDRLDEIYGDIRSL